MTKREKYTYTVVLDIAKNKTTLDRIEREIATNNGLGGLRFWVEANIDVGRPLLDDLFLDRGNYEIFYHDCQDKEKTPDFMGAIRREFRFKPLGNLKVFIFDKPEYLDGGNIASFKGACDNLEYWSDEEGMCPVTVIFTTTGANSSFENWKGYDVTKDDWVALTSRCINCHIEIDVL